MTASTWNAQLYDSQHAFVSEYGRAVLDWLDPQPGERILDLGCGTGELARAIADRGAQVLGIDSAASMIDQARSRYPDLTFDCIAGESLPYAAEFDAVFSNAALHWMTDADAVVQGIVRALKPGGRFVAEFGGRGNVAQIRAAIAASLTAAGYAEAAQRDPWYFPSLGEYASLLEACGLEPVSAALIDRPTRLQDTTAGLQHWLQMFGDSFFANLPAATLNAVLADIEARLRPTLYRDGGWWADYRRLRVVAHRPA